MHGSPCTDFSVAGLGAGGNENSGTRSSLMFETIRIVDKIRPKYVLWENVKNILSKKHKHNFDKYLSRMESLGYHNYYQVLNAKDYGIPQNRERIFVLSCLNDIEYQFPQTQELYISLKSLLEKEVDEKYYISTEKVKRILQQLKSKGNFKNLLDEVAVYERKLIDDTKSDLFNGGKIYNDIAPCLRSSRHGHKICEIQQLGNIVDTGNFENPQEVGYILLMEFAQA